MRGKNKGEDGGMRRKVRGEGGESREGFALSVSGFEERVNCRVEIISASEALIGGNTRSWR